jgi:cytochrome P450/nitrite reductase/ring-hydroxylating ferredoxin subunit
MPVRAVATDTPERVRVASSDDLRGPGPFALSAVGMDLAVVRTEAGLQAFQGRCPHQGALLGEGELDGPALVCRNHRWRFRLADGRRLGGPQCLALHTLVEEDGQVFVDGRTLGSVDTQRPAGTRGLGDLPGPRGLPLLGNLLELDLPRLHEVLESWAAEYGPVYKYRLGPRWIVAVSDPELCEQVLRARPETYRRLSNVEPVFAEMGVAGVFSAEGAAWRSQRRLAMEALSPRHLRGFYPALQTVAERLVRRWEVAAREGGETDILDDLKRFTVDVTTLLTFGHDVNTIEQGEDVVQRRLELVFPAFNRRLFALVPTWRLLRTRADRRLDRARAELRDWLRQLVAETRGRRRAGPQSGAAANFLEAMLLARDDAGRPFSDEVVFGNLMTMLLAGEDTTAYTLGWAVHHLCDSPAAVASLRTELDAALGPRSVPGDFETANRLAYAGAVANEVMRLRPVAPLIFHETNAETVLGDVLLPARTPVVVLPRPATRDPGNFEQPEAFLPERWLETGSGAHEPSTHIPFGSGPRLCPGRTLALLEMKVVLAALFKSFDVERVGAAAGVRERFAFTMSPVGLEVRVRLRA